MTINGTLLLNSSTVKHSFEKSRSSFGPNFHGFWDNTEI